MTRRTVSRSVRSTQSSRPIHYRSATGWVVIPHVPQLSADNLAIPPFGVLSIIIDSRAPLLLQFSYELALDPFALISVYGFPQSEMVCPPESSYFLALCLKDWLWSGQNCSQGKN